MTSAIFGNICIFLMKFLMVCEGFFDDIDITVDHININLVQATDNNIYDQLNIVERHYDAESL